MARCAICGDNRKLTWEHVPPQSAYNDAPLLRRHVIMVERHGGKYAKATSSMGELKRKTLCGQCNTGTARWYVEAYADFTKQMAHYADRCPSGKVAEHPNMDIMISKVISAKILTSLHIYPARVAKQALCMFCATCGTRLADRYPDMYPEIRTRVLNKRSRGKIGDTRLWLYIRSVHGGKWTGLGLRHNRLTSPSEYSEVSFWPAGWVLTFNGEERPKLCEVTHWLRYDYDEKVSLLVHLPHGQTTIEEAWVGELFERNDIPPD